MGKGRGKRGDASEGVDRDGKGEREKERESRERR